MIRKLLRVLVISAVIVMSFLLGASAASAAEIGDSSNWTWLISGETEGVSIDSDGMIEISENVPEKTQYFIVVAKDGSETIAISEVTLHGGNAPAPVDRSLLYAAIAIANSNRGRVLISSFNGDDVPKGRWWVVHDVMATYNIAVGAATTVYANVRAVQSEVDAAVSALNAAGTTFLAARRDGKYEGNPPNPVRPVPENYTIDILTELTKTEVGTSIEYSFDSGKNWTKGVGAKVSASSFIDAIRPYASMAGSETTGSILFRTAETATNAPSISVTVGVSARWEFSNPTGSAAMELIELDRKNQVVQIANLKQYRRFEYKLNLSDASWTPILLNSSDSSSSASLNKTPEISMSGSSSLYLRVRGYNGAAGTHMFSSGNQIVGFSYIPSSDDAYDPIPFGSITVDYIAETTAQTIADNIEYKWSTESDSAYKTGTGAKIALEPGGAAKVLQLRYKADAIKKAGPVYSLDVKARNAANIAGTTFTIVPDGENYKITTSGILCFLEFSDDGGATWKPISFLGNSASVSAQYNKDDVSGSGTVNKTSEPITIRPGATSIQIRAAAYEQKQRIGTDIPTYTGRDASYLQFHGSTTKTVNI